MYLFTNYLNAYVENSKESFSKKLTELIDKVTGNKVNLQTLTMFLYTNKKNLEIKIKKMIPFIIAIIVMRYDVKFNRCARFEC